jgi:chorismate synthase
LTVAQQACRLLKLIFKKNSTAESQRSPKSFQPESRRTKQRSFSGVFNGFTTGAPIALMVENKETKSSDYDAIKDLPRPAHSDYPARIRYGGFNDYRGGGRFSDESQ